MPLVRAVVAMLADWRPAPDVIVVTRSETRHALVADLAARAVPLPPATDRRALGDHRSLGAARPGRHQLGPARGGGDRVATASCSTTPTSFAGDRVLLVDDLVATGWSLTLAADALVSAGADAVLPVTLAVSG